MLCIILSLSVLFTSVFSVEIKDDRGSELVGDYKLLFVWPKPAQLVPNCTYVGYRHIDFEDVPISCECGREEPNLAILYQDSRFIPASVLFDIVGDFDEASRALNDSCQCHPFDRSRVVARKINEDLMLQFEQEGGLKTYLLGKKILSETELRNVITFEGLKYEDGLLVCEAN